MSWEVTVSPLVGREGEMRRLAAALEDAARGRGGLALIGGEAGSGRTRLAHEAGRRHAERGGRVLRGAAYVEEAAAPLGPVVDALRAARRGEPSLWAAVGARAAVLRAALPELAVPGPGGGSDRAVLFEALLDAVEESSGGRTTLWVLDDVHWADAETRAFVRYAARRVAGLRLVLAVTYREEEVGREHPWWADLARLRRDPHAFEVRLPRLSAGDAAALARAAAPGLPPAAVATVVARAAGTPLLVRELARSAAAAPTAAADPLPDAVVVTLRERATRLGAAARELLHVAAVAGVEVEEELLRRMRPQAPADELVAAGLLHRESGWLRFPHPLLREAAAQDVPAARRRALEREIARLPPAAADPLSPRELEVAGLVAEGLSNPAIAGRLFVSRPTVASHVAHILAKLGFSSRAQIAAWVAGRDPGRLRPPA